MKSKTIDEACKKAVDKFTENFGTDPVEHKIFEDSVLDILRKVYSKNTARLLERAIEIADKGMYARDLMHYLDCACIAESEDRNITYEEVLQIIGPRPLKKGENIYHFSNKRHRIGFRGHSKMCFTSETDINDVSAEIDYARPIYIHTCEVIKPKGLLDHDAVAFSHARIEEAIADVLLEGGQFKTSRRWYEQSKKEAIKVISVKELGRRAKQSEETNLGYFS